MARRPRSRGLAKKAVLSALAALLTAAWVLTGWWSASGRLNARGLHAWLNFEGGQLSATLYDIPTTSEWELARRAPGGPAPGVSSTPKGLAKFASCLERWGWWWRYSQTTGSSPTTTIVLPLWPLPALAAISLMIVACADFVRRRRERRRGLCRSCGYDRHGLAGPSTPCPECGAAPTTE